MSITLDGVCQVGLTVFGMAAILMVAKKNRWGFVLGLLSEPFWFITSVVHKQWGVFILTVAFTVSWLIGIHEWFFKEPNKAVAE